MPYGQRDWVMLVKRFVKVQIAYSAISPRLAISTDVSAFAAGAVVELKRVPLAATSWRER